MDSEEAKENINGSAKEKKAYGVFQNIYADYDRMNDVISLRMHRRWKRDFIKQISARGYRSILDVCCGTGDIALQLAAGNPQATVHGLDFSENMLAVAEERKARSGLGNALFHHGNALRLPFADRSFQCAAISFGLRNISGYRQALAEIYRVLEPCGVFYCLESSYPESPLIKPFFRLYFKRVVPILGAVLARGSDEYKWLNDSTEQFLKKSELLELMREVGFAETGVRVYLFGSAALHTGVKPE